VEKVTPKYLGYFCNLKKNTKGNYHPMGENSANLVTLLETWLLFLELSLTVETRLNLLVDQFLEMTSVFALLCKTN
jgi:hypothetical protein